MPQYQNQYLPAELLNKVEGLAVYSVSEGRERLKLEDD